MKAHVVEHSAYRFWDHWLSDGRVPHLFTVDVETGTIRDLFAGTRYELPAADPSAHYYDISPDGREIAFAFDPAEEKRFDHEYHLVALDLRSEALPHAHDGLAALATSARATRPTAAGSRCSPRTCGRAPSPRARLALIDRSERRAARSPSTRWDRSVARAARLDARFVRRVLRTRKTTRAPHLYRWKLGEPASRRSSRSGGTVGDFDVSGDAIAFIRNT